MTSGGIAFLIVTLGTMVHILDKGFRTPGPVVVLLAIVFIKVARIYRYEAPSSMTDGVEARFDRVEQRLSGVQDIVISVDDRLARLEAQAKTTSTTDS
tara:strand:- start:9006 stop:9299 length:294 start_codon:yes stop_codon:yes gene_type:complete